MRSRVIEVLEAGVVRLSHAVAGQGQVGVHPFLHADHQGEGNAPLARDGQHGVLDEAAEVGPVGIAEIGRQRDGHVDRVHALDPLVEKAAHLRQRGLGERGCDAVAPALEGGRPRAVRPCEEEVIQPQGGAEARIGRRALEPHGPFVLVEGIVGHDDAPHLRQAEHLVHVGLHLPALEPGAEFLQVARLRVEAEHIQAREHAAAGLADGRVLHEQLVPDEFGLCGLRQRPEVRVGHRKASVNLCNEVMVGEEFVEAPEQQVAEGRRIDVGVDVEDGRLIHDTADGGLDGGAGLEGRHDFTSR